MVVDIKVAKHQLSRIIESDLFLFKTLGIIMSKLGKKNHH